MKTQLVLLRSWHACQWRVAETSDMIGLTLFLASPGSDFINGQIIYVDGGCTAG